MSAKTLLGRYVKAHAEEEETKQPMAHSAYPCSEGAFGPEVGKAQQISKSFVDEDQEECVVCMARKPDIVLHCLVGRDKIACILFGMHGRLARTEE